MAKKGLLVLVLTAFVVGGAFAQMSAGLGVNYTGNGDSSKTVILGIENTTFGTNVKGGFFGFFDTNFLEADIGFLFRDGGGFYNNKASTSWLTLGLYGKYPLNLPGYKLFPMLGIQLDLALSSKNTSGNDVYTDSERMADALNRFWIKLGVGADLNLGRIYLRPSFLYGWNFGSKITRDAKENASYPYDTFHDGVDFRLAVGLML